MYSMCFCVDRTSWVTAIMVMHCILFNVIHIWRKCLNEINHTIKTAELKKKIFNSNCFWSSHQMVLSKDMLFVLIVNIMFFILIEKFII